MNNGFCLEEIWMDMDKKIQDLHKEVSGEFSPFRLAGYMGIKIIYQPDLDKVLGFYQPIAENHFYINSSIDIEKQEDVCYQLVTHYAANNKKELWITDINLKSLMNYERTMTKIRSSVRNIKSAIYLQRFHISIDLMA
jgi:hypothetical protein